MTIQYFLDKMDTINTDCNRIVNSTQADLENFVSKISLSKNKIEFQLEALFQNSNQNQDVLNKIEKILGLIFIKEEETKNNICFANNDEVRSEYKQSFKKIDLLDYIYAFVHSSVYKEAFKLYIATDTNLFWELVKIGTKLRKEEN